MTTACKCVCGGGGSLVSALRSHKGNKSQEGETRFVLSLCDSRGVGESLLEGGGVTSGVGCVRCAYS